MNYLEISANQKLNENCIVDFKKELDINKINNKFCLLKIIDFNFDLDNFGVKDEEIVSLNIELKHNENISNHEVKISQNNVIEDEKNIVKMKILGEYHLKDISENILHENRIPEKIRENFNLEEYDFENEETLPDELKEWKNCSYCLDSDVNINLGDEKVLKIWFLPYFMNIPDKKQVNTQQLVYVGNKIDISKIDLNEVLRYSLLCQRINISI